MIGCGLPIGVFLCTAIFLLLFLIQSPILFHLYRDDAVVETLARYLSPTDTERAFHYVSATSAKDGIYALPMTTAEYQAACDSQLIHISNDDWPESTFRHLMPRPITSWQFPSIELPPWRIRVAHDSETNLLYAWMWYWPKYYRARELEGQGK